MLTTEEFDNGCNRNNLLALQKKTIKSGASICLDGRSYTIIFLDYKEVIEAHNLASR